MSGAGGVLDARPVCPRCGTETSASGWCSGCGLNLERQPELPTRGAYMAGERERRSLAGHGEIAEPKKAAPSAKAGTPAKPRRIGDREQIDAGARRSRMRGILSRTSAGWLIGVGLTAALLSTAAIAFLAATGGGGVSPARPSEPTSKAGGVATADADESGDSSKAAEADQNDSGNAAPRGSAVSGSDRIVGVWTGEATQHAPSGAQDRAQVRLEIPERTDKVVGSLEEVIKSDDCAGNVILTNRKSDSFEFLYREQRDTAACISTTRFTLTVRSDTQLAFDERYDTSIGRGTVTGTLNLTDETPAPCAGDTDPLC